MNAVKNLFHCFENVHSYLVASVPLNKAFMLSVKAVAKGMVSDIPIVRGLGPRDEPTGIEVVLNCMLPLLSDLDINGET